MSQGTIRDVLARLEAQETELQALRRRLGEPPATRRPQASKPRVPRRIGGTWRLAIGVALVALLALVPVAALAANPFTDLNPGSVHNADIDVIYNAGITKGCTPTTYCPNDTVSREQMASFLARTAGLGSNPPIANAKTAQTATTATNATNATNAQNAVTAQTATNATNATNAVNADKVDDKHANELIRLVGASGSTVSLTGTYQNLITVDITAPAAGFVQVTATLFANGLADCPCTVDFQLTDTVSGAFQEFHTLDLLEANEFFDDSGAASFVFAAPAGPRTFAVRARISSSVGEVQAVVESDADIVALYSPFGGTGQAGTGAGPSPAERPTKNRPRR